MYLISYGWVALESMGFKNSLKPLPLTVAMS